MKTNQNQNNKTQAFIKSSKEPSEASTKQQPRSYEADTEKQRTTDHQHGAEMQFNLVETNQTMLSFFKRTPFLGIATSYSHY